MHEFTPPSPLPRILLVEDHDLTRRMQMRFLSRTYAVDFATSAEEAYQMAFQRPYAVVVLDLNLSGPMSGYALMQHLRATPHHRTTPIVAVTAHQQPGERESLLRAGFDLYLSKPFRWQAFSETIRAAAELSAQDGARRLAAPHPAAHTAGALPSSAPPRPAPYPSAPPSPQPPTPRPSTPYPAPPSGTPTPPAYGTPASPAYGTPAPWGPPPGQRPTQAAPPVAPSQAAPSPPAPSPAAPSPAPHPASPPPAGMPASAPSPWDPPPGARPIPAPGAGPQPWGPPGSRG